jgi:N-methylhydantoinase A
MSGAPTGFGRDELPFSPARAVPARARVEVAPHLRTIVGIDVGGTFTDVVAADGAGRRVAAFKVPSTPGSPDDAVIEGLRRVTEMLRGDERYGGDGFIELVGHGTTVGTNALLERQGRDSALIINKGLSAVYGIRGGTLPSGSDLVDTFYEKVPVLIPQSRTYEIGGRLELTGGELQALDEDGVRAVARSLRERDITSVAVCLLFSYVNPVHERRVAQIIAEEWPRCSVSLSSSVLPVVREYERLSTTVLDAYVSPIVGGYIAGLLDRVQRLDIARHRVFIMQSNGGMARAGIALHHANELLLSGPAAGVVFAAGLAETLGEDSAVTFDMGGTSTDISVVGDKAGIRGFVEGFNSQIAGHDVGTPMIRIRTIGAGGGTIAHVGRDGLLSVGPRSVGAAPGPACYGKGGDEATVTDADAVLGLLPARLAGGARTTDRSLAESAVLARVGDPLGMSSAEAAIGIWRVVNSNMELALRLTLMEWGLDPRGSALVALGGAGPVHAAAVAELAGLSRVIMPATPGLACALGLLQADIVHNYVLSRPGDLVPERAREIEECLLELEERAREETRVESFDTADLRLSRQVFLRYRHQGYDVPVPCDRPVDEDAVRELVGRFHKEHLRVYGMNAPDEIVETVTMRVMSSISRPTAAPLALEERRPAHPAEPVDSGTRDMLFDLDDGVVTAKVFHRDALHAGQRVSGPAAIDQEDTTIVIPPGWHGVQHADGTFVMSRTPPR